MELVVENMPAYKHLTYSQKTLSPHHTLMVLDS